MAHRIRFRLYRIPLAKDIKVGDNDSITIESWQYILGKTENDIDRARADASSSLAGYIQLSAENFIGDVPENALINPLPVFEQGNDEDNTVRLTLSVGSNVYYILKTQVDEEFLNPVPRTFDFYVNPQRIAFNKQKLITEVRTRGGWDIQHWGEKLTEITVEGITGGLHRDITRSSSPGEKGESLQDGESIDKSSAWQSLRILRSIYEVDHGKTRSKQLYKLGFSIFEDFYIGYFQNFNGPEIVVDRPYLMTYSFVFKVEEQISDNPLRLEFQRVDNFGIQA